MKRVFILLLLLLTLWGAAAAETAEDMTAQCKVSFSGTGFSWNRVSDNDLKTLWKSKKYKEMTLTFQVSQGEAGGVYLTFKEALPANVTWVAEYKDTNGDWCVGEKGDLAYLNTFVPVEGETFRLTFKGNKFFTLSIREIRVYSQGEMPQDVQRWQTTADAEALVLLSGQEGQGLPENMWSVEDREATVVALFTKADTFATLDRLADLWAQGVVNYPEMGTFRANQNVQAAKVVKAWKEKTANTFAAQLCRKYCTERVYAPDASAAGADGAVGQTALKAVPLASTLTWDAKSGEKYGVYAPKELYALDGNEIRLAETWETEDVLAKQLSKNLGKVNRPDLSKIQWPQRDEEGYIAEGVFVHSDADTGVWIYLTGDLQIEILRCTAPQTPLTWYEADIKMRDGMTWENVFHKEGTYLAQVPDKIAKANKLVFAVNTDNFHCRYAVDERTGVIIRNGELLLDHMGGTPKDSFPPMETLMLDAQGVFSVYESLEHTAQEYLDMGAEQVYSFGPYLIKDGKLRVLTKSFYKRREPRIGIGMIEPGHYCAVLVEGRLNGVSKGCDLMTLGQLLYAKGCTQASNLDGGHSGVMCFMGEQINRIGTYSGTSYARARTTTELLSVGRYE